MFDPRQHFLPYQLAWIADGARIAVGEKSRRIGWTYASAYRAVDRRLRKGTNLYYTSADLTAAREFVDYCRLWAGLVDAATDGVVEADDSTLMLRFRHNGSLILAGSSNPKFFRSKGGDADADEFAFHQDERGLLKAMQPSGAVWDHQLRIWSTHNGEGSFFNQIVQEGRRTGSGFGVQGLKKEGGGVWSFHRVTLLDAVAQGLVEKVKGLSQPNATARRDFLDEVRATCPGEDAWNEEYLCRPSTESKSLLPYALIRACEVARQGSGGARGQGREDGVAPLSPAPALPCSPAPLYAGFDVGRSHDNSVVWVVEKVGDVLWTREVRVMDDMPFSTQEQLVGVLMQRLNIRRLCVDCTGMGKMIAERLVERFGHRVEAVHFTQQVKTDLAMPLLRLFQDRQIRVPADADVREDLHKVRKVVTTSGNIRLEADRDDKGHADRFWALALAAHAALDAPTPLPASVARKPIDW